VSDAKRAPLELAEADGTERAGFLAQRAFYYGRVIRNPDAALDRV
jgi:hypothetical protein